MISSFAIINYIYYKTSKCYQVNNYFIFLFSKYFIFMNEKKHNIYRSDYWMWKKQEPGSICTPTLS